MPYEIQQTRWDRLVRRVSGSIGPGSRVGVSISDLFPVLDVERVPGELLLLSGTNLAQGAVSATGAAGEVPNCILVNPNSSNHLITITQVAASLDAIGSIRAEVVLATPGLRANTERFREGRLVTATTLPLGQVRSVSNASLAAQQVQFEVLADVSRFFADENGVAVLSPGTSYLVSSNTLASTMTVTFWWRERIAEQSELNL